MLTFRYAGAYNVGVKKIIKKSVKKFPQQK